MFPPDPRILAEDAKPTRLHWAVWLALAAGVAAIVFYAIVPGVRLKMQDSAFRDIRENDSVETVAEGMSAPATSSEPARPDLHRWWGDEANPAVRPGDIAEVITWRLRFPTGDVMWQVGFDNQSRAIAKHRYD